MKTKTITFSLFGLLTALLAGLSIALYVIDWNQYRDTLADLASERMGVQVELGGDLSLTFLPRPAVSARLVRISPGQAGFNDAIATADKIDMSLGLGALVTGSLELQSLALDGLAASIVETETGWALEGWPAAQENSDGGTTLLSLDRFRINSGSISIVPLGAEPIAVEGLDLTLAGQLPRGPLDWQGSAIVAGESVEVEGRVAPTRTVDATSIKSTLTFDEGMIDFSGRFMPDGAVQGRLQTEGANLKAFSNSLAAVTSRATIGAVPALRFGLDMQVERDARGVSRLISRRAFLGETRSVLDVTVAESDSSVHLAGTMSVGVVPLDAWLETMEFNTTAQTPPGEVAATSVSGGIDLNIETIEFRGDQAQQVGAIVGFEAGGPTLTQASALLPGASRFSYLATGDDTGSFQFQSGGLQEMLAWAGVGVSDAVPAGRLRTADLKGSIGFTGNAWVVTDLTGAVDTSNVVGEVSGTSAPLSVNAVRMDADKLNLDAYWPTPQLSAGAQEGQQQRQIDPIDFAISVGSLHWLNQNLSDFSATGSLASDRITISSSSVRHMDGTAQASFEFQSDGADSYDVAASVSFNAWRFPVLTEMAPDAGQFVNLFTGNLPASGVLELTGPSTGLQTRVEVQTTNSQLSLAGTLSDGPEWQGRLQGAVSHAQFGKLLHRARLWQAGSNNSLALSSNVSLEGTPSAYSATATGSIGGAQFNLSHQMSGTGLSGEVSVAAGPNQSTDLDTIAADFGYQLDQSAPRRARVSYASSETGWQLNDIDIRNGQTAVGGSLSQENSRIEGALSVASLDMSRFSSTGSGGDSSPAAGTQILDIALEVSDLQWMGQALEAPNAQVTGNGQQYTADLGEGASLNNALLAANLSFAPASGDLAAKLNASAIDIGRFSQAIEAADGFSGVVSASLDLTGNSLATEGLLSTLSGQGRFEGGAGSLYFMAVPELINAIQSENTSRSFLNSIGRLLRSGTTDFATIRGSFQLDSGVALVDELLASGDWGQLELDGQLNIPGDYINVSGALALARPLDAPAIPVTYEGALSNPNVRWTSRAVEQFAIAGIERRLRTRLFGELETAEAGRAGGAAPNPGSIVSDIAAGLLGQLKARQEARKQAAEDSETNGSTSPNSEEQRP